MALRRCLIWLVILPGLLVVAGAAYGALLDWAALRAAYARFAVVSRGSGDMRALFIAEAQQNIHRVNLFADGVWLLLGAVLVAIGLVGLCIIEAKK
jgi:hypothetical protein